MSLFSDVYDVCKEIPRGKVTTYGQIAMAIGRPKCSRQVGWALHGCPDTETIPWHRVLNRFGELCKGLEFGTMEIQKQLLESEGIEVSLDYTVDLKKYMWVK